MSPWTAELCCDITPKVIDWLWPRYLPRGKLAILDGDPEMGKSLLTIALIARFTRGGATPDGELLTRESTCILLSAEDDAEDTIRPRAEAACVDLSRLVIPKLNGKMPKFPDDIPALEELIRERGADLVVIDPLMAFLPPKVSANIDQCVRLALTPLADMASRTGCAVLMVRHLTKCKRDRAILRGQGNIGIVAAMRTALFVAPHPKDPTARVFAVAKKNLGARPPSLGYRVVESPEGQPVIEWTGPVDLTADEAGRDAPCEVRPRERACLWLKQELASGPRKAADLYIAAAAAGIPDRTLNRAKAALGVDSQQVVGKGDVRVWYWYDPAVDWPKDAPFKRPFRLEPLRV